jgi:uncharacterized coiled-coil protein SlyX
MTLAKIRADVAALMKQVFGDKPPTAAAADGAEPDIAAIAADVTALQTQVAELVQLRTELVTAKQTIATLQGQVKEKDTTIAERDGKLTELNGKVTSLESTIADPKGAIELEVGKRVAAGLAAQGLPVDKLPAGSGAKGGTIEMKVAELRKQMETASPMEKSQLATQIRELLSPQKD